MGGRKKGKRKRKLPVIPGNYILVYINAVTTDLKVFPAKIFYSTSFLAFRTTPGLHLVFVRRFGATTAVSRVKTEQFLEVYLALI